MYYKRKCIRCGAVFFCGGKGCTLAGENAEDCWCLSCSTNHSNGFRNTTQCPKFDVTDETFITKMALEEL